MSLQRFVDAQDVDGTYERALAELRAGCKRTHWMWFVFPQLAGLGRSPTARYYAIGDLDEARAYLRHDVLGPRLRQCASALCELDSHDPVAVFGSVDAIKLRSSMTLFAVVDDRDESVFAAVLDQYFAGERDEATLVLLG